MTLSAIAFFFYFITAFPSYGADAETLDRLEKIIQQQQAQIEAQQKALEQLQEQVEALKRQADAVPAKAAGESPVAVESVAGAMVAGETAEDSQAAAEAAKDRPAAGDAAGESPVAVKSVEGEMVAGETAEDSQAMAKAAQAAKDKPGAVKSLNPKATVTLYGHVDKAVLYSNDGDTGNLYLVDNDNSSTRLGVLAAIEPDDNYRIGSRIEMEYQTNPSNLVNQNDKRLDDSGFEKRHLDLWVGTNSLGKLSLGWGSTASDGISELDLSDTVIVGYSDISGMAGGQLFYDKSTGQLSGTPIRAVFSNMDGLGRDERIRYDTPSFGGFTGSVSYIADGGGDFAIRYIAKVDALKLAAGAAYANPGSTSTAIDDQLAGSVSVLHESGFSGTFAMGTRDNKGAGRNDAGFFYTKFGYKANWWPLGVTSLSLDYGRHSDISVNGDNADTFGFQMVQDIQEWGTEAFLGYRFHKLDRDGVDYDNINAIMSGMRVKF